MTSPAVKLRFDATGRLIPSGNTVTSPDDVGLTAVTFSTTAGAPDGGPPFPPATRRPALLVAPPPRRSRRVVGPTGGGAPAGAVPGVHQPARRRRDVPAGRHVRRLHYLDIGCLDERDPVVVADRVVLRGARVQLVGVRGPRRDVVGVVVVGGYPRLHRVGLAGRDRVLAERHRRGGRRATAGGIGRAFRVGAAINRDRAGPGLRLDPRIRGQGVRG